jgi:dTDP-4-dehydrorhamnose reductase
LGSNGQLGTILSLELARMNFKVMALSKATLDVTDSNAVLKAMTEIEPELIVNCAAWTDVNLAEDFPTKANLVNAESLRGITNACVSLGIRLIHISTDHVFSGNQVLPYAVNAKRVPVNKYGESKLAGEVLIENSDLKEYWILRTSWLYGNSSNDFIAKIIKKFRGTQGPIPVVCDQIGHPTFVNDLVKMIINVISNEPDFGTYHASNSGTTSWFNFAQEAVRLLGLDANRIMPIKYSDLNLKVNRPDHVALDFSKWAEVGLAPMRSWNIALSECLSEGGVNVKY